jgi:hypothetical protein
VYLRNLHEADEAGSATALPDKGPGLAKAQYLQDRREVELNLLSEWVPRLDADTTKVNNPVSLGLFDERSDFPPQG